jgi:hypothetical protein
MFYPTDLAPATLKSYNNTLKNLNGGEVPTTLDYLKDTAKITEQLLTKKENTRKTNVVAIVSALKGRRGFTKQLKYYTAMMEDLREKVDASYALHAKSPAQESKWVNDMDAVKANLKSPLDKLVFALFTLTPPRRSQDYAVMLIGEPKQDSFNYYHNKQFTFNTFKTSKLTGTQTIDIPELLQKEIDEYMKTYKCNNKQDYFLCDEGKPIDNTKKMYRRLVKVFGCGASILRNVQTTDSQPIQEAIQLLQDTATQMGTSPDMLMNVYSKVVPVPIE